MTNKEKVEKALALINKADIKDEHITPAEIFNGIRHETLDNLAEDLDNLVEDFATFVNLIYDIRDILEGEE